MKEVKKLFSKFNTKLKPFINNVKSRFESINKIFKSNIKMLAFILTLLIAPTTSNSLSIHYMGTHLATQLPTTPSCDLGEL